MAVQTNTIQRQDRCTCPANGAPKRTLHHPTCAGRNKDGWRARLPEFLQTEVNAIEQGVERETPIDVYRDLAIEYAHRARHGAQAFVPAPPAPVLIEIPERFYDGPETAQGQRQAHG